MMNSLTWISEEGRLRLYYNNERTEVFIGYANNIHMYIIKGLGDEFNWYKIFDDAKDYAEREFLKYCRQSKIKNLNEYLE